MFNLYMCRVGVCVRECVRVCVCVCVNHTCVCVREKGVDASPCACICTVLGSGASILVGMHILFLNGADATE